MTASGGGKMESLLQEPSTAQPSPGQPTAGPIGFSSPASKRLSLTLADIRRRAHAKWVAAGRPDGDSSRFWLEAEQELLEEESIGIQLKEAPAADVAY
jgi:hypothetical protein